jgi:circadian clock protein KaiC
VTNPPHQKTTSKCKTGVPGLDEIIGGGIPKNRFFLVQGSPGVGKTTLALQFLLEGVKSGEKSLYICLSETREELFATSKSHGWDIDGFEILELSALQEQLEAESPNTLFHPSEVELNRTTDLIKAEIERVKPERIVFDSLSEMRLLAEHPLRYRRQMLILKHYFSRKGMTIMLLDDDSSTSADLQVQSIAHGVLELEQQVPNYGSERRRLKVVKLRGVKIRGGYHDFSILTGGIVVYPRLIASEYPRNFESRVLSSGIPALDDLTGGGLTAGSSTLIMGPAGTGKSTLGAQFAVAATKRGERVLLYSFDENQHVLLDRLKQIGLDMETYIQNGLLCHRQIDPAELSPGEMTHEIQKSVAKNPTAILILDSLNGYLNAMPDERHLGLHLHELLTYLGRQGVATIMCAAQHGIIGDELTPADVTYLADAVMVLRYFEVGGAVKKAVAVIKKRGGHHENTIREFRITSSGLVVGEPLTQFHGVLRGVPEYHGSTEQILTENDARPGAQQL